MTLNQLIEIRESAGLNIDGQRAIISLVDQRRFYFGVRNLPEINCMRHHLRQHF